MDLWRLAHALCGARLQSVKRFVQPIGDRRAQRKVKLHFVWFQHAPRQIRTWRPAGSD